MSAWLCGNGTLSLVADVIKSAEFAEKYDPNTLWSYREPIDLVQKLSSYNSENLDYLYGTDSDNYENNLEYVELNVSDAQKHKSVACYLYQTTDLPYNRDILLLQSLRKWVEDHRAEFEPWWDTVEWDIDRSL